MSMGYPSYKKKIIQYSSSHPDDTLNTDEISLSSAGIGILDVNNELNNCDFLRSDDQRYSMRYNQEHQHNSGEHDDDDDDGEDISPENDDERYHPPNRLFKQHHHKHVPPPPLPQQQDFLISTNSQPQRLGYYNQYQSPPSYGDEPVYEEILQNCGGVNGSVDDEDEDQMDEDSSFRIHEIGGNNKENIIRQSSR